jgi:hypothetical protein
MNALGCSARKMVFIYCGCSSGVTDQADFQSARNYWKVLKHRLLKDGNEAVTNCNQLKLQAGDGKLRMTDVSDTVQLFFLSLAVRNHRKINSIKGQFLYKTL